MLPRAVNYSVSVSGHLRGGREGVSVVDSCQKTNIGYSASQSAGNMAARIPIKEDFVYSDFMKYDRLG